MYPNVYELYIYISSSSKYCDSVEIKCVNLITLNKIFSTGGDGFIH